MVVGGACRDKGGPEPCVPLHKLRSVFVTDRMDNPDVPGPSMQSAAAAMLHSTRQWVEGPYDLHRKRRLMTDGAAGLQRYRDHQLAAYRQRHAAAGEGSEEEGEWESEWKSEQDESG